MKSADGGRKGAEEVGRAVSAHDDAPMHSSVLDGQVRM